MEPTGRQVLWFLRHPFNGPNSHLHPSSGNFNFKAVLQGMYHSASINLQWYVAAASAQTEAKQPEPLRLVWRKLQYNDEPMEVHISTDIIQMVCWVASVNPIYIQVFWISGDHTKCHNPSDGMEWGWRSALGPAAFCLRSRALPTLGET